MEMPELGLLTLELELEETGLKDPGTVKYAGRLLIPGDLPTPLPAFSRVVAEREGKEPVISDDIILPIGVPKVGVEWEWFKPPRPVARIPLGEYFGELNFEEIGEYKIHAEAYPTPVRMLPTLAKTEPFSFIVGEPPRVFRFSSITIDGNAVSLTDHDADSGLLLDKTTADYLEIVPAWEWTGPETEATISIKAGYKDWMGAFSPKTDAYTAAITLPSAPDIPVEGEVTEPIRVPLTACGGLDDGAIEVVLKVAGMRDYISRIWNVYATKVAEKELLVESLVLS